MLFHSVILRWVGFASGSSWSERSDASQRRLFLGKLRHLALFGTTWQHWATKCHESSPLSSEPGPPASYYIIWFVYCAILRFPVFPCFSLFSLESTRLPPVSPVSSCVFFRFRECNGSRWFCCKLPYFSVCSPTFGPCCWAPPFAEPPMPCCRLKDPKVDQVSSSYRELPKGTGEIEIADTRGGTQ